MQKTHGTVGRVSGGARYFAFALTVSQRARKEIRDELLERLVDAVRVEAQQRAHCRDVDVSAATRVRAW